MVPDPRGAVSTTKTVVGAIKRQNVTFMAAGIAYQAFISLLPLLVLVFVLVSVVGDEGLAARVTEMTEGFLPDSGRELLGESIEGSVGGAGTSIIGVVTLLWGSLKIFRGLDTAFSEIYGTTGGNSIVDQLIDGLVVFGVLAVALLAAGAASTVFALFPEIPFIGILNPLLLIVGLSVAFLPMYYRFPDVDVGVREVIPGVLVAAVGWAALQALFQVYVAFAGSSESAGALGAILLLLTWLYFGGLVLLVGGVVNATLSGRLPALDEEKEEGGADAGQSGPASPFGPGEPGVRSAENRDRRERERLRRRIDELEREQALLENDLEAQRARRYRLEDRTDRLEAENERLERENRELRLSLDRRRKPPWRRALSRLVDRARTVNVGTVRESGE